jgi:DUF1009 family protein
MKTLGIIAGGGDLPKKIIQVCQNINRPFFILALEGFADRGLVEAVSHEWCKIGAIQKAIDTFKKNNVQEILFVGHVKRPSLSTVSLDKTGVKWLAKIGIKAFGDDGLLSGILNLVEKEGFKIIKAQDIAKDLIIEKGTVTKTQPDEKDWEDIRRGIDAAQKLGAADIGQSVIVEEGVVLSVEGIEGTDAMISRTASLKKHKNKGVLVKIVKPQQNRSVDMPTTGVETVKNAIDIGLKGMAIQALGTLVLDRDKMIELADKNDFFIEAVEIV